MPQDVDVSGQPILIRTYHGPTVGWRNVIEGEITDAFGALISTGYSVDTDPCAIELGILRTGEGPAYIDFHTAIPTQDYGFRVLRQAGENGEVFISNTGTGTMRIQQEGAGDMHLDVQGAADFLVSTNGVERLRSDLNGNTYLGPTTGNAWTQTEAMLNINFTDDDPWGVKLQMWDPDFFGPSILFARSAGTVVGQQIAVANGTTMGELWFGASDGIEMQLGAYIQAEVDGTVSPDNMPTRIVLGTRANGVTGLPSTKFTLHHNGAIDCLVGSGTFFIDGSTGGALYTTHNGGAFEGYLNEAVGGLEAWQGFNRLDTHGSNVPIAQIDFMGTNSVPSTYFRFGRIQHFVESATNGSEKSNYRFFARRGGGVESELARLGGSDTAGHTALMVWDNDNGLLERVSVGAAGSGGVGFKVLRIPD